MNKVIKKDDWKVSVWSGGTTNEIFIYPENSSYVDRAFKARMQLQIMERSHYLQIYQVWKDIYQNYQEI